MRRAPPLEAIEAFAAAMRAKTFRAAADELGLSSSAFARRIAVLEVHLGVALFVRRGGKPVPTEAARAFLAEIEPSLRALENAGRGLRRAEEPADLRILVAPSLAAEWLVPRLAEGLLGTTMSDYTLEVGAPGAELDPARHDLAILAAREGDAPDPSDRLVSIEAAVVSAPVMADHRPPPRNPQTVGDFDRLDMHFPEGLWRLWSERVGAPMPRERPASRFTSLATMYEAAAAGFGLALGVPLISERRLSEGLLQPCFRGLTHLGFDYCVFYRNAAVRGRNDVQTLVERLRDAAEESATTFRKLAA